RVGAHHGGGSCGQQHQARRGRQVREGPCGTLHSGADRLLERLEHGVKIPGTVIAHAIDEDGRRSRHSIAPPVGEVLIDTLPQRGLAAVTLETVHVETERGCNLEQGALIDWRLATVERIVHLPVAALAAGGFRTDRQELRAGMGALIRKMPEHVDHALGERGPQSIEHEPQTTAIGAEKITVNEDRQRPRARLAAADMVPSWIDRPKEAALATWCAHAGDLSRSHPPRKRGLRERARTLPVLRA